MIKGKHFVVFIITMPRPIAYKTGTIQPPNTDKILKYYEDDMSIDKKEIYELYNKKHYMDFLQLINRIQYEFHLLYPKLYAKYDKWCSYYEHLLPNDVVLKLLNINNHKEYQIMRDASFECIRKIGVETGGSNVQFAINPKNGRMIIIEMNPRVSRSSALASKAASKYED